MKSSIFIGPAGWSYPDWKGTFYPSKSSRAFDPLNFVSSYFNLIEINSTFYRVPSRSTCKSWADRVSSSTEFRFNLKAFKEFTHDKTPISESSIRSYRRAVEPICEAGRLGYVLFQFPWSFRFNRENLLRIKRLASSFSPLPVAVEVRHGGWATSDAMSLLKELDVAMCGIDQPQIGNSLGPDKFFPGKAGFYFRLHGRNAAQWFKEDTTRDMRYNYLYAGGELDDWIRKIREAMKVDPRVHLVLNNHFRGQAAVNSFEIKAMLSGEKIPIPASLIKAFPRLSKIAEIESTLRGSSEERTSQISLFHNGKNKNGKKD